MSKHHDYWVKRMSDIFEYLDQSDLEFFYRLQEIYADYCRQIQKEIYAFYQKYAEDNKISLAEAKRRLLGDDLSDYKSNAEKYLKQAEKDPELLNRLKEQYSAGKVTKLEALYLEISYLHAKMGKELQGSFHDYLKNVAKEIYKKIRFGKSASSLNEKAIETILNLKWNGRNYSTAIWGEVDKLAQDIKKALMDGFTYGKGPAEIARELRKKYNVSRARAETIVRTDGTFVTNNATIQRFIDAGLTKYEFMAHIDDRTTKDCRGLNKQVFNIEDFAPGENAPPMHYNCRSTIIPDADEIEMDYEYDSKAQTMKEKKEAEQNKKHKKRKRR